MFRHRLSIKSRRTAQEPLRHQGSRGRDPSCPRHGPLKLSSTDTWLHASGIHT
jgi:hypothetical protein